jgi:hypothetical protein
MSNDNHTKPPFVVNRGRTVQAVYRTPEIAAHEGNPLEEALPPMLTTDQLILRLQHFPAYNESQRKDPDETRYLLVQNGMRFFVPLDIHMDLYRRFTNLTRIGYAGRNPLAHLLRLPGKSNSNTFDQYDSQYDLAEDQLASTAAGFNIIGISGIGKSFSIDRILKLFPQVIHHNSYRGHDFTQSQVVWLKIDCPFDGNPRGLCNSFFKTMDAILGTNFRTSYMKSRRLQTELLGDMATVAGNHFLGVLVIDEIQRLSLAKSGGADALLNFLVQLVNEIGVPVVLVGTYKALPVLSGEFSQMRRGTGQGDLIWDRMPNDEQWGMLVKSLFRTQYTRKSFSPDDLEKLSKKDRVMRPTYAPQKLSDVLYEETQGITDLAVKVYMFAQERAIDTDKEIVTPEIIRSVAKDKFGMLRDVLLALKYGDKQALARWEDVYPLALKAYLISLPEEAQEDLQVEGKAASSPDIKGMLDAAQKIAVLKQTVSAESPSVENPVTANAAPTPSVNQLSGESAAAKPKAGKKKPRKPRGKGLLPSLISTLDDKEAMAAYEAIKQAGYIRSSREFTS